MDLYHVNSVLYLKKYIRIYKEILYFCLPFHNLGPCLYFFPATLGTEISRKAGHRDRVGHRADRGPGNRLGP